VWCLLCLGRGGWLRWIADAAPAHLYDGLDFMVGKCVFDAWVDALVLGGYAFDQLLASQFQKQFGLFAGN
jgi:hypothetical protein